MKKQQIVALLECQNMLNDAVIGKGWHQTDLNFALAGAQECSEGIDHLSWKWWKKSAINLEAAKMEVVDLLHFHLSMMLVDQHSYGTDAVVETALVQILQKNMTYDDGQRVVEMATAGVIPLFQSLQNQFYHNRVSLGNIIVLFERLGGTEEQLLSLYYQKAVLNLFRANNGYKTGEYVKEWAPQREDNDFIPALSEGIDWTDLESAHTLYHRLEEKYQQVKTAQTH